MKVHIGDYTYDASDRVIDIHIDDYDVWGMDSTLAIIIVPMIERLKEKTHGAPCIEANEVPERLVSMEVDDNWDGPGEHDNNIFKTWNNVLDEFIWVFSRIREDDIIERNTAESATVGYEKHTMFGNTWYANDAKIEEEYKRVQEGCELFGKFFQNLWD